MSILLRALLLLTALLVGCSTREAIDESSGSTGQGASSDTLNSTTLAIYLPANYRKARIYLNKHWLSPGKALEDSASAVAQHYFQKSFLVEPGDTRPYGLLLTMQPEWKGENGNMKIVVAYKVFAADGAPLLEGSHEYSDRFNYQNSDYYYNDALRTTQLIVTDLLDKLTPSGTKYPETNQFASIDPKRYVNNDKPTLTGTGFLINNKGQAVTAAHVVQDCARIEVRRDDKPFNGKLATATPLIDLAVINTGVNSGTPLPLRKGEELKLGEAVANVGFPLQPLLSPDPSLTRGNISSRSGLSGGLGQFQFSAPIQPGSSGGPVVSDEGELLGVTQSTLNPTLLIQKGILPQNVNFALEARYVAMFLKRNNVPFTEVNPTSSGNPDAGNKAALSSVISVACYQ